MSKGQIVEIDKSYRKSIFGQKYGVVSKVVDLRPICEITVPLPNGMRVMAYVPRYALKPVKKEEVTL